MASHPALRRMPIASAQHGVRLLGASLSREILLALSSEGAMSTNELVAWLVAGSRTKVDECLKELRAFELLAERFEDGVRRFTLTLAGRELIGLIELVRTWLTTHPHRPFEPSSPLGWRAFAAATDSWRAVIFEWIVRCAPASGEALPDIPARHLRKELDGLRAVGVVSLRADRDGVERYILTPWGRRLLGILAAIARWELTHLPERAAPLEIDDGIVALLGTLPLVRLPESPSGLCSFTIELEPGSPGSPRAAAVWAAVRRGRVAACGEGIAPGSPDAWASGPFSAWLAAVIDDRPAALRVDGLDGKDGLALAVIADLHRRLYTP